MSEGSLSTYTFLKCQQSNQDWLREFVAKTSTKRMSMTVIRLKYQDSPLMAFQQQII